MTDAEMLTAVKKLLGITDTTQDDTLSQLIYEVTAFIVDAGVPARNITAGLVARGVSDLWDYTAGQGQFSKYFMQRLTQLSYKA